jgi:hypothetical protein
MDTIAQALLPPAFVWTVPVCLGLAAAGVAVGVTLLLWGRWAGRVVFLAAGAVVGWWAGGLLAARMQVNPLAAQLTTAVAAGLLTLVVTPLLWALLAGALAGGAAVYFTVLHFQPELLTKMPSLPLTADELNAWCTAMADHLVKYLLAAWADRPAPIAVAAGLAGGLPFIVGAIRLRLATIVMSSLSGGAAIVAGAACLVGTAAPSVAPTLWKNWFILGGAAAALALAGVIIQYRRAIKADKDKKNREGEPPGPLEKQGPPARSAP